MVIIVSSNWLAMLLPGLSAMTAGTGVVRHRPVAIGSLKIVRVKNFISPDVSTPTICARTFYSSLCHIVVVLTITS